MQSILQLPKSWKAYYFESIDSTNSELLRMARHSAVHGTVVIADQQTQGRGRQQKHWESPLGNLYFSFLIDCNVEQAPLLSFITIVSLAQAIEIEVGHQVSSLSFKWPNDLLNQGQKVAGILLEYAPDSNQVVIGLGVNLSTAPVSEVGYPIGCLKHLSIERQDLIGMVCSEFSKNFIHLKDYGFSEFRHLWLQRAKGIGKNISIKIGKDCISGIFRGISNSGELELVDSVGEVKIFSAGEVL